MTNAWYPDWKQDIMTGANSSPLNSGTGLSVILVDTGTYIYASTDNFFNDLSGTYGDGGTARANAEVLGSLTYVDGTLDAADSSFADTGVNTSGTTVEGFILFVNDGVADLSSPLVAYFDASITGMPFSTSSASQVDLAWNASGIWDL